MFEIVKTHSGYASTPATLVSFCALSNCADGSVPNANLIADANGNLFGTTRDGGLGNGGASYGSGTAFEIVKTAGGYANTPTTLVSFCLLANCADGSAPFAGLIADADGNLFGTTLSGGAHNGGTVFEVVKMAGGFASTPTTLVSFCALANCADGQYLRAGLIADANGNLFGATEAGGTYGGTVFEIAKTAGGYATTPNTVSFNRTNGAGPEASLIADAAGNLFGTTSGGGANGAGTVFEITGSEFVPSAPFASLSAALVINRGQQPGFTLDARFRLGAGSDGIDPLTEPVMLQIGPYKAAIPADAFRKLPGRGLRVYAFSGEASNAWLTLDILSLGRNSYQFGASGTSFTLRVPNPVPVSLRIGYDAGSTLVRAVRVP